MQDPATRSSPLSRRRMRLIIASAAAFLIVLILLPGMVPANMLRSLIIDKLQGASDRDVAVGTVGPTGSGSTGST